MPGLFACFSHAGKQSTGSQGKRVVHVAGEEAPAHDGTHDNGHAHGT